MPTLKEYLEDAIPQTQSITRDAFLYMEPTEKTYNPKEFAQCSSCMMWTGKPKELCHIHGKDHVIRGTMSCGLYVNGKPMPEGPIMALVTPQESGLVERKVRCENCAYGNPDTFQCALYRGLNQVSEVFSLNERIHPLGCCNSQTQKSGS